MDVYRRLKEFYWKYRYLGFASILCMAFGTAVSVVSPVLLRQVVDKVIIGGNYGELPLLALGVLLAAALRALFLFGKSYIGHVFGAAAVYDLRNTLYEKLQGMSFSYYDKARTGDLMSRLAGDVEAFRQFLAFGLVNLIDFFLMFIFGLSLMMTMNWRLTLVVIVTMPGLAFLVLKFRTRVHSSFSRVRRAAADINTIVQENITGMRTVKSFAREAQQIANFEVKNTEYHDSNVDVAALWGKYFPTMEFFANCSVLLLLWYGGSQVINGSLTIGGFVAFSSLIWYIIGPVQQLGYHINNLTLSIAAGERVLEILAGKSSIVDAPGAMELGKVKGHVKFDNVSFSYEKGIPVLNSINIDAPPGAVIGLIGPTGAGKSTICSLLYRGYDVSDGRILIDGHDIREVTLSSLRRNIASVFQETFLFSTTIYENIRYGRRDASEEDIINAAKLAQAHDFIMELPLGYQTLVGERGLGLSGGQKQRIAIARAILADPRIIVFDDATASVDMETEHEIQVGIANLTEGRTTFIIAHRISSLKHADEILVIDCGKIIERGTHESLLARKGQYYRIYQVQFGDMISGAAV